MELETMEAAVGDAATPRLPGAPRAASSRGEVGPEPSVETWSSPEHVV